MEEKANHCFFFDRVFIIVRFIFFWDIVHLKMKSAIFFYLKNYNPHFHKKRVMTRFARENNEMFYSQKEI